MLNFIFSSLLLKAFSASLPEKILHAKQTACVGQVRQGNRQGFNGIPNPTIMSEGNRKFISDLGRLPFNP